VRLVGAAVADVRVELPNEVTFPHAVAASAAVNQLLCVAVREAVTAGRLPIVMVGSCDAAVGGTRVGVRGRRAVAGVSAARRGSIVDMALVDQGRRAR
jgi:hypothetical protein